ncbi:HD domain-containing phosphohydrolase [Pseudarthrobacter sp. MEB009]|uniref:HD domain-containing phosphohydrolase n=1 Tax=Pseudarthrobacter sp. MEB009 TaxID=3040326 RepID=UPI0025557528|nr:HD domain-containing phosphohydrolase [Pseudarthrobacter sp. MEB009]
MKQSPAGPRRSEILAALSLAIDLGLGQPMEHMLRSCLLALRIAGAAGVDAAGQGRLYYANQVAWIGCHADSFELAALFTDDIAFRADYYNRDQHGLPMYAGMFSHAGAGLPPLARVAHWTRFAVTGSAAVRTMIASHCTSAGALASNVGLGGGVAGLLAHTFERWDGKGLPDGIAGPAIPLEMRIMHLADTAEVFLRQEGVAGAVAMVRARRGSQFDPALANLFIDHAEVLTEGLLEVDCWQAALDLAPADAPLSGPQLDAVLRAVGDFADLKSPYTAGHSRAVAALAAAAGEVHGLPAADVNELRRAGWVHDLGRLGVSNQVWDKKGPLSRADLERIHMHPYLGERILSRVPGLKGEAALAGLHQERMDGSGYPRGIGGTELGIKQRILAAADSYGASLEPRPHRAAIPPSDAAGRLRQEVSAGRISPEAADAVLAAAGQQPHRRPAPPAGLTPRELEILGMLCHGMAPAQIAATLLLSTKTVRNHVEHIYTKIGATNRVGATLFAVRNGLTH